MGNINTFLRHLWLPNMSWGFRFQRATVLVNISITKSSFIVLSECLLLAQSCVALVFSHGYMQQRKERRVDNVQKMESVSNFWAQNGNAERTGNGNFVWCKICARNKSAVVQHPNSTDPIKTSVMVFVNGTNFVTKHT